jgi:hypothetical protein
MAGEMVLEGFVYYGSSIVGWEPGTFAAEVVVNPCSEVNLYFPSKVINVSEETKRVAAD